MPIVPDEWKYQVSAGTRKQFGVLRQLMKRDDVESLVCATDAGREGELIFRLVYHQCCCNLKGFGFLLWKIPLSERDLPI